jgi:hypothetical protein
MTSSKTTARLAGWLWFLNVATTAFGLAYVRPRLIIFADAALTAGNLAANEPLFRTAVISNLLASLFLFFFGLTVYHLFKRGKSGRGHRVRGFHCVGERGRGR